MSWFVVILGYFLGAIPTAYLAGRFSKKVDIRRVGDENMGAANAFRELGARTGIAVGLVDAGKGALAVLIARAVSAPEIAVLLSGAAAVIGHNFPVFLNFRGGRGVSTTVGVMYALLTLPMLILTVPAVVVLFLTKNATLASAVLFIALPVVAWWLGIPFHLIVFGIALSCLVALTHYFRTRRRAERPT